MVIGRTLGIGTGNGDWVQNQTGREVVFERINLVDGIKKVLIGLNMRSSVGNTKIELAILCFGFVSLELVEIGIKLT